MEQPTETEGWYIILCLLCIERFSLFVLLVLRSLSKKQAVSTPGSESTPNTTAMTPPASEAGSMEQPSALSRSGLLRPLSAVKSVFSGAMFNRTETTKTDVAADGSFRTQSTLVAQDCQDIEQLEEEEEEEEGGTAEGPTSYSHGSQQCSRRGLLKRPSRLMPSPCVSCPQALAHCTWLLSTCAVLQHFY